MEVQTILNLHNENILIKSFSELYPEKKVPKLVIKYSNKFSHYNGNVKFQKMGRNILSLEFSLSKKFKDCEEEIQIGIIQELLNKVYKTKINTLNQDLYHNFIKHLTNYTKKGESNSFLKELFDEINEEYFSSLMDEPTLKIGKKSYRILGNYNYSKDTITISSVFFDENKVCVERDLTKYVLYHEMLHKKHKFKRVNNQNRHHTSEFKEDESKYKTPNMEERLKNFLVKERLKKEIKKLNPFKMLKNKIKNKFFGA